MLRPLLAIWASSRRRITCPSALSDLLMLLASFSWSPTAPEVFWFSLPAGDSSHFRRWMWQWVTRFRYVFLMSGKAICLQQSAGHHCQWAASHTHVLQQAKREGLLGYQSGIQCQAAQSSWQGFSRPWGLF